MPHHAHSRLCQIRSPTSPYLHPPGTDHLTCGMFSWLRGQGGEEAPDEDYEWVPQTSSFSQESSTFGHPLKLVDYNASEGTFQLGAEALDVLRSVKGPIGVVALCGRARQGKSYILNQLLGRNSAFQVASTHRPCTKGLWMWSRPLPRESKDGRKYHLVLLDTEGIGSYDQTGQYSTQIFSLAVLLSSLFVYNQMGGIDEASIDQLALVAEMSKKIMMNSDGQPDASEAQYSPSFLWLLRDFYLDLVEDGQKIEPNEYLEITLTKTLDSNPSSHARNQTRESIKNLFPSRECATLVRPVNDEDDLKILDSLDEKTLRPEFRKGVEDLTQRIFETALPKCLGDHVLSGVSLAGLAEAYVQAINQGAVPVISSAWQGVAQSECLKAVDAAEEKYSAVFSREVLANEEDLDKEHTQALSEAKKVFYSLAIGDESTKNHFASRLEDSLSKSYAALKESKLAEAMAEVDSLLSKANADLQKAINGGILPRNLHTQMKNFVEEYMEFAAGPTKWQSLCGFLQDVYGFTLVEWLDGARKDTDKAQSEAAGVKQSMLELQTQLDSLNGELHNTKQKLMDSAHQASYEKVREQGLEEQIASLREKMSSVEKDLTLAKSREEEWRHRSESAERSLLEARKDMNETRERASSLQQELNLVQGENSRRIREWELERQRDAQEILRLKEIDEKAGEDEIEKRIKEALSSERAKSSNELAQLRLEHNDFELRHNRLVAENAKLSRMLQEKNISRSNAEIDYERIRTEKAEAIHQVNEKSAELAALKQKFESTLEEKQLSIADAIQRLELEQRRSKELLSQNSELKLRISEIECRVSEMNPKSCETCETTVKRKRKESPAASLSGNGISAGGASGSDPGQNLLKPEAMTINEIKQWLLDHGCEALVYDMSASRKRLKKSDWVTVLKEQIDLRI